MSPSENGYLRTVGKYVVNQSLKPIQLRGMSSHGLGWFPQYYNEHVLNWLKTDWKADVFRAAMYTEGYRGYLEDKKGNMDRIRALVNAAIQEDMYIIIDWHILSDGNPLTYLEEAKVFFEQVSSEFKDVPNVVYEICNEPNGWNGNWVNIRSYANQVVPIIRKNTDNLIIVGTPTWSQDVNEPAMDPLQFPNIAYAVHFYSGTHGRWLVDRILYALKKDIAIFASEWGVSDSSGSGGVYIDESTQWLNFLDKESISWCNWSLTNKDETSAALKSWANHQGGWSEADLTESGNYVRRMLRGKYGL